MRVGPVLGHFGVHLGVKIIKNVGLLFGFVEIQFFDEDKVYNRVWDQTWVDLGAQRAQNECQNGPQVDSKIIPKTMNTYDVILMDFGLRQGVAMTSGRSQRGRKLAVPGPPQAHS